MKKYLDFDLRIASSGAEYVAEVVDSPVGRSDPCPITLPFPRSDLPRIMLELENAILRATKRLRGGFATPSEKALREFGSGLFDSVFMQSEIRTRYESSLLKVGDALGQGSAAAHAGLRIRLQIDAPELFILPWEYLYDRRKAQYLNLAPISPVLRYLKMNQPETELMVDGPLRVLGMIANPATPKWAALDTEKERRVIDEAVTPLERAGLIQFEWVQGETWRHLMEKIRQGSWHVFHFIGHGGLEEDADGNIGGFVVMMHDGEPMRVYTDRLNVLLSGAASLRLVVLNCCEGGKGSSENVFASPGAALVKSGIPAVVAMQFPIGDEAAIEFASGFYKTLAESCSVDGALTLSRQQMYMRSDVEWGIPTLITRAARTQIFTRLATDTSSGTGRERTETRATGAVSEPERTPRQAAPQPHAPMRVAEQPAAARDRGTASVDEDMQARAETHIALAQRTTDSNPEQAIAELGKAMDLIGPSAELLAQRAELYGRLRLFLSALDDIDAAIALASGEPRLHYMKGMLHTLAAGMDNRLQDDPALAVEAFSRAIERDPLNAAYYNARGTAQSSAERYQDAVKDLSRAIELSPNHAEYYRHRGIVHLKLANFMDATRDLEESSRLGDRRATEELARRRFQERFNRGKGTGGRPQ